MRSAAQSALECGDGALQNLAERRRRISPGFSDSRHRHRSRLGLLSVVETGIGITLDQATSRRHFQLQVIEQALRAITRTITKRARD
jgi:hypothetical protein